MTLRRCRPLKRATKLPKTALVTGATGTVGRAVTTALCSKGYRVVICGTNKRRTETLASELTDGGNAVIPLTLDLRDSRSVKSALFDIDAGGVRPLVLVNAAAKFGPMGSLASIPHEQWEELMQVNFLGLVTLVECLLPRMLEAKYGRIFQITTSEAQSRPKFGNAPYSVSKAAANRYLAHLSSEFGKLGVSANAIVPGEIKSNMWRYVRDRSTGIVGLERFADWAVRTDLFPDDPSATGKCVLGLLENDSVKSEGGFMFWAQNPNKRENL